MKIDQLIDKMMKLDVKLPLGSGRDGAVLACDLERALGNHFYEERRKTADEKGRIRLDHLALRMRMDPMKAYRYDKLSAENQRIAMESEHWYLEEKYNGWRIVLTYIRGHGFAAFGGNLSDVDHLPVDYTDKILFEVRDHDGTHLLPLDHPRFHECVNAPSAAIDTEVLCHSIVENRKGSFSSNTLDTVGMILSLPPSEAQALQIGGAKLELKAFDFVEFECLRPLFSVNYVNRRMRLLTEACCKAWPDAVQIAESTTVEKASKLRTIWNRGGEGCVLKYARGNYIPGGRMKEVAIKVKRTMSGEIGDDIDAFVSGFVLTQEWTKLNLIGGVELSVYLNGKEHVVATVSSMPDEVREALTLKPSTEHGMPILREEYMFKVLTIDGQELSGRNRKLLHAKADWHKGFRSDKDATHCTLTIEDFESAMF